MAWIEVKVRYDKMQENGTVKKVSEPYLVDAVSCTEAEARITDEVTRYISGDFNVIGCNKRKIAEVFYRGDGSDRYYMVKYNLITLDEKTGAEKKTSVYVLVEAPDFETALDAFKQGMTGTMADFEIESIAETKIVEVFAYKAPSESK